MTEHQFRFEVWWVAAGCLYDSESPAFVSDDLNEVRAWLQSDDAAEYWEAAGENTTYRFEIIDNGAFAA